MDNGRQLQDIKYKIQIKETESGTIADYISFFIEVNSSLGELTREIKVLPLIVKPNDEIYSFDFQFDTFFIRLKGKDESTSIGCAKRKKPTENNEYYKTFVIAPCGQEEYFKYLALFKKNYTGKMTINPYAMEGTMLIYKEESAI